MNISNSYPVMIFRKDFEKNISYVMGISKKEKDGSYTKGYIPVQFKKDVIIQNKTKINIVHGWLTFYLKDNKTMPYIFINEYVIADEYIPNPEGTKIEYKTKENISLEFNDDDMPF